MADAPPAAAPVIKNAHRLAPGADPSLRASWTPLSGEDFLKYGPDGSGMDQGRANMIRSIANGDSQYPTGFFLKTPEGQQLARDTQMFDPSFSVINLPARQAARVRFTSGKSADEIAAADRAIRHAVSLYDAIGQLGNAHAPKNVGEAVLATIPGGPGTNASWLPGLNNSVAHTIANVTGTHQRFAAYTPYRQGLIEEAAKFFKGGVPDVHTTQQYEGMINPDDPPEVQRAAVLSLIQMINTGLQTKAAQYSRAMGRAQDPYDVLSPEGRAGITQLLGTGRAPPPSHTPAQPVPARPAFPGPRAAPAQSGGRPSLDQIFGR